MTAATPSIPTKNMLDLSFHMHKSELEKQLNETPNLQQIDHLVLKAGETTKLKQEFLPLFQKFEGRLDGLKVLELHVHVTASKCNGQQCAQQLLQGYSDILALNEKVKKEGRQVIFHATAYNYNLDTIDDLNICLKLLGQDTRLQGINVQIDDSQLQKLLHKQESDELIVEFDVELRQAMDD